MDGSTILSSYLKKFFFGCGLEASITIPYRLYRSVLPRLVFANGVYVLNVYDGAAFAFYFG